MKNELVHKSLIEGAKKVGKVLAVPALVAGVGAVSLAAPQKAEAEGIYGGVQAGYLFPSDAAYQQIYGGLMEAGGELGYEFNGGFRFSFELNSGFASGTPILSGNTSGISATAQLSNVDLQVRLSQAFDIGAAVPYIGVEGSYDAFTETITASDNYGDTASTTSNFGLTGYGGFVGVEFAIPNSNVEPYIEFLYNSIPIGSSSQGGLGKNFGGDTISAGIRF